MGSRHVMPNFSEERYPRPFAYAITSTGSSGTQATVSVTGSTGIYSVVRDVTFSIVQASAGTGISSANATMNVIDGSTGATTILWTGAVSLSSTGMLPLTIYLDRPASKAGTLTAEFSAGTTAGIQTVSMGYYTSK